MIEDFQDSVDAARLKPKKEKTGNRRGMLLVLFVLWVVFVSVFILVSMPKIENALSEINAVYIIKNRKKLRRNADTVNVDLFFILLNVNGSYTLYPFEKSVKNTHASLLHTAIEGLLSGADSNVLNKGAVSLIPKGTHLRGLTLSNGVCFVDFSREFLNNSGMLSSQNMPDGTVLALKQILKTVQNIDSTIENVVILIEGKDSGFMI